MSILLTILGVVFIGFPLGVWAGLSWMRNVRRGEFAEEYGDE